MSRRGLVWKTMFLACCIIVGSSSPVAKATERPPWQRFFDVYERLMAEKDYAGAEAVLSIGIEKHPRAARLFYHRATVRGDFLGKTYDAILDYTKVIKIDDESCSECKKSYCYRGWALYRLGEYELAVEDLSKSIQVMPVYRKVHLYRAKAYAKLGMFNEARVDCQSYIRYFPGSRSLALAVLQKIEEGRTDFD